MIETDFFILTSEQVNENLPEAQKLGVSLDYYLLEFCNVVGDWVVPD